MNVINLVKDTISFEEIKKLTAWLETNPRLTKGQQTVEFEDEWSRWLGVKHSIFVNSGSSANLAITYALKIANRLKNNKVVVPAVSWATTVAPVIQFGLEPILCDACPKTLGIDIENFRQICEKERPSALILVHVLGIPCRMDEIINICNEYDVLLVEDTCESVGSLYGEKKLGTFGIASSFSFYYGHHLSTIEGGMICTNDTEFYNVLKSLRCHGWDRDLDDNTQGKLREKHGIDDFRALYSFYYPGFNLRSTDLQAFLGRNQLLKLDSMVEQRRRNFLTYEERISNKFWRIEAENKMMISSMAYPIITPKIEELVKELHRNQIETRPLICGSIGQQPFWKKIFGEQKLPMASLVHEKGLYVPNNHELNTGEINLICDVINNVLE